MASSNVSTLDQENGVKAEGRMAARSNEGILLPLTCDDLPKNFSAAIVPPLRL